MSEKWELTDEAREGLLNSLSAIWPGLLARDDKWRAKYVHFAWLRINELEKEVKELRGWAEIGKMSHDMIEQQGHVCVFDHSRAHPECNVCGRPAKQ